VQTGANVTYSGAGDPSAWHGSVISSPTLYGISDPRYMVVICGATKHIETIRLVITFFIIILLCQCLWYTILSYLHMHCPVLLSFVYWTKVQNTGQSG